MGWKNNKKNPKGKFSPLHCYGGDSGTSKHINILDIITCSLNQCLQKRYMSLKKWNTYHKEWLKISLVRTYWTFGGYAVVNHPCFT